MVSLCVPKTSYGSRKFNPRDTRGEALSPKTHIYSIFPALERSRHGLRNHQRRAGHAAHWRRGRRLDARQSQTQINADLRALIRRISVDNPLGGGAAHPWRAAKVADLHKNPRIDRSDDVGLAEVGSRISF